MARRGMRLVVLLLALPLALAAVPAAAVVGQHQNEGRRSPITTNATYFNNAATPGADPYVRFDEQSGYYYAYSTAGSDPGYQFAIYRSPDLATWEKIPGGAIPDSDQNQWGHDWFWAPEVYHNDRTGLYFLFYAARMNTHVAENFTFPDFEEPCKIGVAVSRSPQGPFHNITDHPISYYPYDPNYHDVNRIMGPDQKKPPETLAEGKTAPLGTYIPYIDPNVFFDDDGRIYLYFSRNAYRNWVWDTDLQKYVEESNIYAVELTGAWWNDPTGNTMPTIAPRYINANNAPGDSPSVRKDGFTPILNYEDDKQPWENADVNDYAKSHGQKKDRRWEEGSTTVKYYYQEGGKRRAAYYLTYSANNYQTPRYGVGYAVSDSPLGPWRKSPANPILTQAPSQSMYSTGHGSIVASPDGSQLYYVHHGRPSTTADRSIYTERMRIDPSRSDVGGAPRMSIGQSTGDEPVPSGVAPYRVTPDRHVVHAHPGDTADLDVTVTSTAGAAFDLTNPLNRLHATVAPRGAATVDVDGGRVRIRPQRPGITRLTVSYQRLSGDGRYFDVENIAGQRVEWPAATTVVVVSRY